MTGRKSFAREGCSLDDDPGIEALREAGDDHNATMDLLHGVEHAIDYAVGEDQAINETLDGQQHGAVTEDTDTVGPDELGRRWTRWTVDSGPGPGPG